MRRSRIDFERLLAELSSDVRDLDLVVAENARAWERIEHGATDRLDWAALGYTIHNIYGVMETYLLVDELRSFRHLFRNLYARPLDPDRTRLVQARVQPAASAFAAAHTEFVAEMREIANALDDAD